MRDYKNGHDREPDKRPEIGPDDVENLIDFDNSDDEDNIEVDVEEDHEELSEMQVVDEAAQLLDQDDGGEIQEIPGNMPEVVFEFDPMNEVASGSNESRGSLQVLHEFGPGNDVVGASSTEEIPGNLPEVMLEYDPGNGRAGVSSGRDPQEIVEQQVLDLAEVLIEMVEEKSGTKESFYDPNGKSSGPDVSPENELKRKNPKMRNSESEESQNAIQSGSRQCTSEKLHAVGDSNIQSDASADISGHLDSGLLDPIEDDSQRSEQECDRMKSGLVSVLHQEDHQEKVGNLVTQDAAVEPQDNLGHRVDYIVPEEQDNLLEEQLENVPVFVPEPLEPQKVENMEEDIVAENV